MLQTLRSSVGSWAAKIILLLLVGSFAIWGIQFDFSSTGQAVVQAGDQEVSPTEFVQAYRARVAALRQQGIDTSRLPQELIAGQVLGQLQNQALFEAETKALSISSSDEIYIRDTHENEQFAGSDGKFDIDVFRAILDRAGMNENYYTYNRKRELAISSLIGAVDSSAKAPKTISSTLYKYLRETRDINYLSFPIDRTIALEPATPEMLESFYEERKEAFRAPEYRSITFVEITPSKLASGIEISEEQVKEAYDQRLDQYTKKETRKIYQMPLADKATADKAYAALQQGGDFIEVGKEFAGLGEGDLLLGSVSLSDIPDEGLAETAFSLEKNSFSEPKEGLFGWYIVKAAEVSEESVTPLADVADGLKRSLAIEEAGQLAYDLSQDFDDRVGSGATFEEAAGALNLPIRTIEKLNRRGEDAAGTEVKDLPARSEFLEFAFTTEQGLDSLMQSNGNEGFYILRVDSIEESRIKTFDEVSEEVHALWTDAQYRDAAVATAEKLVQDLNTGAKIEEIASARGVQFIAAKKTDRSGNSVPLLAPMISDLFTLAKGQATSNVDDKTVTIATVAEIHQPELDQHQEEIESLQANIGNSIRNDLLEQYLSALRSKHGINVNEPLVSQLLAQQQQ
ncbi:SurA N-terminal domain-containing protein [Aestuariispira insulae]|uniref:Parvulin-like PPIase n=1 Tax=Aestuariispira insulae TaxID=1461337 RepID=A0A3D9HV36_9PROT|nr:SurA N-terminal domain-containing protein [Aestuariispira insulae]RED53275.1 peptidyl-prolyl cis-trans isomerase D [Aestuariispira insulae]